MAKWLVSATNIGKVFYFSSPASRRLDNVIVLKMKNFFYARWHGGSSSLVVLPSRHATCIIRSFYFIAEQPDSPSKLTLHYDREQFHYTGPYLLPSDVQGRGGGFHTSSPRPEVFIRFILRQSSYSHALKTSLVMISDYGYKPFLSENARFSPCFNDQSKACG